MHKSQLGKFAPAIVTIGSHAVKVTIDRHAASLRALASRDDRTATGMFLHKRVITGHISPMNPPTGASSVPRAPLQARPRLRNSGCSGERGRHERYDTDDIRQRKAMEQKAEPAHHCRAA